MATFCETDMLGGRVPKLRIEDLRIGDVATLIQLGGLLEESLSSLVEAIDRSSRNTILTPEVTVFARGFVKELRKARVLLGYDEGW